MCLHTDKKELRRESCKNSITLTSVQNEFPLSLLLPGAFLLKFTLNTRRFGKLLFYTMYTITFL